MQLSKKSIDAIIAFEVTSPEYYTKKYQNPTWPGGDSGVTIGIGYDLGMNSRQQIINDWTGLVNPNYISVMASIAGVTGLNAKRKLANAVVRAVNIPFSAAYNVFVNKTLPRFCKAALAAFPGLDKLNPDTQGAIVSLVYNRGNRTKDIDTKAHDREEMRDLITAIANADYPTIATEIKSMKRLWDGVPDYDGDKEQKVAGLMDRRELEGNIVLNSITDTALQYESAVSFAV